MVMNRLKNLKTNLMMVFLVDTDSDIDDTRNSARSRNLTGGKRSRDKLSPTPPNGCFDLSMVNENWPNGNRNGQYEPQGVRRSRGLGTTQG